VEELGVMKELPERRLESYKRERVKVDSGSLIYADRNVYSVPSRLIGEEVEARLYMDRVEIWYGQRKLEEMPRLLSAGSRCDSHPIVAARSSQVKSEYRVCSPLTT
jgi:hypothetical protein